MKETLLVSLLFLVLFGATCFYFYSRMLYSERKISLLESVLLDIKMSMEMEHEAKNDHMPAIPPPPKHMDGMEELKDDTAYYSAVLEELSDVAATADIPVADVPVASVPVASVPPVAVSDYESMNRDELAAMAEKRGLRVTKRQAKTNIISLLRESDKNSSDASQTGKDGPVGSANSFPTMEGSSGGAPLEMDGVEELV